MWEGEKKKKKTAEVYKGLGILEKQLVAQDVFLVLAGLRGGDETVNEVRVSTSYLTARRARSHPGQKVQGDAQPVPERWQLL